MQGTAAGRAVELLRGHPLERMVANHYNRCHPDDRFDDLMRRASFSKEDRRLLEDWFEAARRMAQRR